MCTWAAQCEVQLQLVVRAELAQMWQLHVRHNARLALHDLAASTALITIWTISMYIDPEGQTCGGKGAWHEFALPALFKSHSKRCS